MVIKLMDMTLTDLLADKTLGAGNFVYRLAEAGLGDKTLLTLDDDIPLGLSKIPKTLSVATILKFADSIATWYQSIGVEPKDPVGLWFDDNILYFLNYIALTRIGAIPVHINGDLAPAVTAEFVKRVGARNIVLQASRTSLLAPHIARHETLVLLREIESVPHNLPPSYRTFHHLPDDPVLIAHSSGTTGMPKAVQFNHEGFIFGVKKEFSRLVGTRVLSALPHSHASAISVLMSAMLRGCQIKIQTRKSPEELLTSIGRFKPDLFCSFPKVYVDLCRAELEESDLDSIQYWLSTGDANHEPHIRRLMTFGRHLRDGVWHAGSCFIDNLGSSEFGFAAFRNVHRPGVKSDERYDRCIGRAFDWVDAEVLDDVGNVLPPGTVGKLGVRSRSVTPGYWNDTLLSEKNRLGGYWLTGDLVYRSEEGIYYHVDRTSDAIVTRDGILYSCQAEELVLKNCKEIFDCSIVGVDVANGEKVAVLTAEVTQMVNKDELLARLNKLFAQYGLPKLHKLIFEEARRDTGVTGKKLKRVLRTRLAETAES